MEERCMICETMPMSLLERGFPERAFKGTILLCILTQLSPIILCNLLAHYASYDLEYQSDCDYYRGASARFA